MTRISWPLWPLNLKFTVTIDSVYVGTPAYEIWTKSVRSWWTIGEKSGDLWWNCPIYVDLFGKPSISLTFFGKRSISFDLFGIFWINSIDSIIPIPQSQSTQWPSLWKRIDSITNQLTWKRNCIVGQKRCLTIIFQNSMWPTWAARFHSLPNLSRSSVLI